MGISYGPNSEMLINGRPIWYGLNGRGITDLEAGELLRDIKRRRVCLTVLRDGRERVSVSTVFLVIDSGFMEPEPVLWETMVFGGPMDAYDWRYKSRQEARLGHKIVVSDVRATIRLAQSVRARRRRMHKTYKAAWA